MGYSHRAAIGHRFRMLTLLVRGDSSHLMSRDLRRDLRRQFGRALRAASAAQAEVCLSLTADAELLELNRRYAGEDHATDVLSFAQQEAAAVLPQGAAAAAVLGDIVISLDTAGRQAGAAGHEILHELLHLSVHGLCHLL